MATAHQTTILSGEAFASGDQIEAWHDGRLCTHKPGGSGRIGSYQGQLLIKTRSSRAGNNTRRGAFA